MSIFVSCGEVSGDIYAADLIRELQAQDPSLKGQIWGMMGPRGTAACGSTACGQDEQALPSWSYEELKLMGFTEILSAIPRVLRLRSAMVKKILKHQPRAVVLIDSPDFHLGLASKLRRAGYKGKTVCLATPTVWAWRSGRTKILRDAFDLCLPLFSFENDFLKARGVNSLWTAHPLVEGMKDCRAPSELSQRKDAPRLIALMPGSRRYDIRYHLDRLVDTASLLQNKGFSPVFSVAPGLSSDLKEQLKHRLSAFETWEGEGRDLMAASAAVVAVSGTVSVEALLLNRYMVVLYNGEGLSWLLARLLVRIPYISIPNYLTDSPVYPELLRASARSERIFEELTRYLNDPDFKKRVEARMQKARLAMGSGSAAIFWAGKILN